MDKVFKVVAATVVDNSVVLRSAMMGFCGDFVREYQIRKAVQPFEGSYLYAFRTFEDAEAYAEKAEKIATPYLTLQIWGASADVVNVEHPLQAFGDIELFWAENQFGMDILPGNISPCPPGTVWCHSLQLVDHINGHAPKNPKMKENKKYGWR